jgi:sn-glycerol 3-phosphate transport system substrate-binding protein
MLSSWVTSGYFTLLGRGAGGERRFANGECAMMTSSSAQLCELRSQAKFDFGAAQPAYYDDIKGAPHHSLIGGRWPVGAGRQEAVGIPRGSALPFLARAPRGAGRLAPETGYVPVTRAAYELTAQKGF